MDESALLSKLNNLVALRSSLHGSLRFWEWMVVVGLGVDLIVILKEHWDGLKDFWHGEIHPPERPSTLLLVLALLGTGLIAFGISEELSVDSKIEEKETEIRLVNEQLFGIVSYEAEAASDASARAKTDARLAKDEADDANRISGQAKVKAESVEKQTDELRSKAEELSKGQRKLAELQIAIEQKESTLANTLDEYSRDLSVQFVPNDNVIAKLKALPPLNIVIWYQDGRSDTALLAGSIASMFPFAGWGHPEPKPITSVVGELKRRFGGIAERNFVLVRHSKESDSENALFDVLRSFNRSGGEEIDDSLPAGTVEIFVEQQIGRVFPRIPSDVPPPRHRMN